MAACLGAFERWRCHHVESASVENDEPESIPSPPGNLLDETDLRERLKQWSLPFVEARIVERKSELASAAADLRYPVVLKHLLEGQSHKTEHDAVALNVIDESELLAQSTRMDRGGKWLVQSMVDGAIEAFIGVSRDPQLGPVISVGMGGVLVELIADVTSGPAPLDADAARNLIASTRLGSLIAGYRGARPGDFESLVGLVVRVSQIATEWTELVELDLNPVMVLEVGEGVVIVDARARAL
jgi:acetyltransferase